MAPTWSRRRWLAYAGTSVSALVIASAYGAEQTPEKGAAKDVTGAEDLMREHGVLRRILMVYAETARRLARSEPTVPVDALIKAAGLFRRFGEEYHERSLEEKHIFPTLTQHGGPNADLARILISQHDRGRQITDYILAATRTGKISPSDVRPVADTLSSFVWMYQEHTAIEDTVAFPAWKSLLSASQYHELSEQFENIEHQTFGRDGFEEAVHTVAGIEQAFGLANLAAFTAPTPPKAAA